MPGSLMDDAILKDLLQGFIYPVTPVTMIGRDEDAHIRVDSKPGETRFQVRLPIRPAKEGA